MPLDKNYIKEYIDQINSNIDKKELILWAIFDNFAKDLESDKSMSVGNIPPILELLRNLKEHSIIINNPLKDVLYETLTFHRDNLGFSIPQNDIEKGLGIIDLLGVLDCELS
ncbi:MAG TPA: hypothetical protein LFW21_00225 [Rickettsia endosymbiont of Pyrocoelia pectoralis]|nr:hypothetical protein [Rickettsia endosymbiont of Pyrocoelia pectoralis]